MKRVRLTVDPGDAELPLAFERATGDEGVPYRVQVVNWNVATAPAAFLLRVEGRYREFETLLEADAAVTEYEVLPLTERACYCFVTGGGTPAAWRLWEQFAAGSLMTVPPAEWNADGSYTFTVVGTQSDIAEAVRTVPEGVSVTVEAVGGRRVAEDSVLGRLTDRQRTVLRTALDCGYYDVPRDATIEDVARELDCAVSTAAEHLQKAEGTVVRNLLE